MEHRGDAGEWNKTISLILCQCGDEMSVISTSLTKRARAPPRALIFFCREREEERSAAGDPLVSYPALCLCPSSPPLSPLVRPPAPLGERGGEMKEHRRQKSSSWKSVAGCVKEVLWREERREKSAERERGATHTHHYT